MSKSIPLIGLSIGGPCPPISIVGPPWIPDGSSDPKDINEKDSPSIDVASTIISYRSPGEILIRVAFTGALSNPPSEAII